MLARYVQTFEHCFPYSFSFWLKLGRGDNTKSNQTFNFQLYVLRVSSIMYWQNEIHLSFDFQFEDAS